MKFTLPVKCQEQYLSFKTNQMNMIPLKVEYPLSTYRTGAVSAVCGTHFGEKVINET